MPRARKVPKLPELQPTPEQIAKMANVADAMYWKRGAWIVRTLDGYAMQIEGTHIGTAPTLGSAMYQMTEVAGPRTAPSKTNPEVYRKPGAAIVSEANALQMMRQLAQDILDGGTPKEAKDNAATIVGYCDVLLGQVKSGIHANPSLVTFAAGNPSVVLSDHVQAVLYRHKKDGEFYIHTFGGKDVPIREIRGRQMFFFDELPARTGVEMRSDKRVVVFRRPDGKPLADDF